MTAFSDDPDDGLKGISSDCPDDTNLTPFRSEVYLRIGKIILQIKSNQDLFVTYMVIQISQLDRLLIDNIVRI